MYSQWLWCSRYSSGRFPCMGLMWISLIWCQEDRNWIGKHMNCCRNVTRAATGIDHCSPCIELLPGESYVWNNEGVGCTRVYKQNLKYLLVSVSVVAIHAGAQEMHSGHSPIHFLIRVFPHPLPLFSHLLHLLHCPLIFPSHLPSLLTKPVFLLCLSEYHIHINRHRWRAIGYVNSEFVWWTVSVQYFSIQPLAI